MAENTQFAWLLRLVPHAVPQQAPQKPLSAWTAAGVERLASLLREGFAQTGEWRLLLAAAALDASGRGRPEHDNSTVRDAIGTTYLIERVQRLWTSN